MAQTADPYASLSSLTAPDKAAILDAFIGQSRSFIVITDTDTAHTDGPHIEFISERTVRSLGIPRDQLEGKRLSAYYPKKFLPEIRQQMEEVMRTGRAHIVEWQVTPPGHTSVNWFEINTIPIFDSTGRLRRFMRLTTNVTPRKQLEQQRDTGQILLASVFGVIDRALVILDNQGHFTMLNSALSRQFGWSVMELAGKPFADIVAPADRDRLAGEIFEASKIGVTVHHSLRLRHKDGTEIAAALIFTPIASPDGQRYIVLTISPIEAASAPSGSAMNQKLRAIMATGTGTPAIVAGRLQLVGLEAVRTQLGERWLEISERAFAVAEQILRRHLTPVDVFERRGSDGFIVCFTELSEVEAQFKARAIGKEIRERLIGEIPEIKEPILEAYATRVEISKSEIDQPDADITASLDARLNREKKRIEETAQQTMRSTLASAQIAFQAMRTESNHPAPILMARLPTPLEEALQTLLALGQNNYRVETETLLLTGAAERVLSEIAHNNRMDLLFVPVQLETLMNRRDAERWLQVARSLGEAGKKRIVVEITGITRDTGTRLNDLLPLLMPMFRSISIEMPDTESSFLPLLPKTVSIVTIPLRRLGSESSRVVAEQATQLMRHLSARRIRLVVKDVSTTAQAVALAQSGVQLFLTSQVSW